jgi:uncharacterized protein (DUF111 family)
MNILYLDCYAGISGDMTVAALLDLGVPLEHLHAELAKLLLPPDSYTLSTHPVERQHMPALKFDVSVSDHHTHRHYADLDAMISRSSLSDPVKDRAQRIFRLVKQYNVSAAESCRFVAQRTPSKMENDFYSRLAHSIDVGEKLDRFMRNSAATSKPG